MNCEYCNKVFEKKAYGGHIGHCKENPNFNRIYPSTKGRKHSEETKKKISDIRKEYLKNNPDKVPYKLNHSHKESYPETYFKPLLKDFIFQYQIPGTLYCADFANPIEKYIIEIDGEQHYVDSRIVNHDTIRNNKLTELGWNVSRIRWSSFQKLQSIEKEEIIRELNNHKIVDFTELIDNSIKCIDCGKAIQSRSTRCIACNNKILNNSLQKFVISKEDLIELLKDYSMCAIGRKFNVSSNAVKKRCIKYGIEYKRKSLQE